MAIQSSGNEMVDAMGGIPITGNVTPQEWYQFIKRPNGKPNLLAIAILSDIVYWYRPVDHRDEITGQLIGWRKKFNGDLLQKSYKAYVKLFGESRNSVKAAFDLLEEMDIIKRVFRDIEHNDGTENNNVMFVALNTDKIREMSEVDKMSNGKKEEENDTPPLKFWGRVVIKNDGDIRENGAVEEEKNTTLPQNFDIPPSNVQETNTYNTTENKTETTSEIKGDYDQSFTSFIPSGRTDEENPYNRLVKDNIRYDELIRRNPDNIALIERMVKIMADILGSKDDKIFIAKELRSMDEVKIRFMSIKLENIEHVIDSLPEDDSRIVLKDKFLMAYMYNSPETMGQICRARRNRQDPTINMALRRERRYDFEELEREALESEQ